MKFAIVIVLLASAVCVYSQASGQGQNLSAQDVAVIQNILNKIVGPKLSKVLTKLIGLLVNGAFDKVKIGSVMPLVINFLTSGSNANAASGSTIKIFTPADQKALFSVLSRTVGPYTASNIVETVGVLVNGLSGKIPLNTILHRVTEVVGKVLNPTSEPVSQVLAAVGR